MLRANPSTWLVASPRAVPGFVLNEMVTLGSCPVWFTSIGPTVRDVCVTDASGTRIPLRERT